MPRSMWTGSISFGLVQIPVGLYPAENNDQISFSLLDKRDMSPIRYERVNRATGKPVPWDDIVRGYQYEKDEYVVMSDEELRGANVEATQTVDILDFVDAREIEPRYFDKPYYLAPLRQKRRSLTKAYVLLREALTRTGMIGIAKVVIRTREHLAAVMPQGQALVLNLLRFPNELRSEEDLDLPKKELAASTVGEKELEMAERLVTEMATAWDPERYKDEYRDDVLKLVEKKVKAGKTKTILPPEKGAEPTGRTGNVDIIALLKKSLSEKKEGGGRGEARPSPAKAGRSKASSRKGGGSRRAA